ncbi:efflux RND transporter periplasmic adaptor subunit [Bowmanella yangjiangensis]|uniref:Efflux RND transporter periplasmic adaptor subunit n=1 Tax=Bowmanella yangjiangensis TaxID=2811230 RepID=A0ABS3CR59_9ALTE|nr:efflux RND transporter periplasmic adaptor subunit [Bowmanella yangjiangensis]MBN7819583.1 efflux RND transporter periplasmic adaptor subunit [Bowmanella yangjiangensis]
MTNKRNISPVLIILLLVAALTVYVYLPNEQEQNQRMMQVVPVKVQEVKEQEFAVLIEALGTARANEAVAITALESEIVDSIVFDDGDLVEKGQLLVSLNNREEKARVNELEVNLQEAKRQLVRIRDLAKENATSAQLLDAQEARVNALAAQLEVANARLAELEIRAPFRGRLGIRRISKGALVKPGDVITTLDDLTQIKVDFSISESHLPDVAKGQLVIASTVAYPGEAFHGEISSLDSRIDPVTRAVQVRAIIDNTELKLRPGMLLQINLQKQVLNTLILPEGALLPIQDKQYVYVVDSDNRAHQTEVNVGRRKPGVAQILSGIESGDKVVVEGTLRLSEGVQVRIQE